MDSPSATGCSGVEVTESRRDSSTRAEPSPDGGEHAVLRSGLTPVSTF